MCFAHCIIQLSLQICRNTVAWVTVTQCSLPLTLCGQASGNSFYKRFSSYSFSWVCICMTALVCRSAQSPWWTSALESTLIFWVINPQLDSTMYVTNTKVWHLTYNLWKGLHSWIQAVSGACSQDQNACAWNTLKENNHFIHVNVDKLTFLSVFMHFFFDTQL